MTKWLDVDEELDRFQSAVEQWEEKFQPDEFHNLLTQVKEYLDLKLEEAGDTAESNVIEFEEEAV